MQETTVRKLRRVLGLIIDYRAANIQLPYLVDSLEGTLRSMEESLPKAFLSTWQDASFNLETIYALGKESALPQEIEKELGILETLILNILRNEKDEPAG